MSRWDVGKLGGIKSKGLIYCLPFGTANVLQNLLRDSLGTNAPADRTFSLRETLRERLRSAPDH